jgi:hypothetical protein
LSVITIVRTNEQASVNYTITVRFKKKWTLKKVFFEMGISLSILEFGLKKWYILKVHVPKFFVTFSDFLYLCAFKRTRSKCKKRTFPPTSGMLSVWLVSSNFFQIFQGGVAKIILPLSIFKIGSFLVKIWESQQWPPFENTISLKLCWILSQPCISKMYCWEAQIFNRSDPFLKMESGKIIFATWTSKIWKKCDDKTITEIVLFLNKKCMIFTFTSASQKWKDSRKIWKHEKV